MVFLFSLCSLLLCVSFCFFFFNDTATTEIYTLSLHDALPSCRTPGCWPWSWPWLSASCATRTARSPPPARSEEHTSELQSQFHLVCRLLLEKKKKSTTPRSFFQKKTI